jgi:hypothetical protein
VTIRGQVPHKIARDSEAGQKRRRSTPPAEQTQLRNEILRDLGDGLPDEQWGRRSRNDVRWLAQQFDSDDIATLVQAFMLLDVFGDSFIAAHFTRDDKRRRGWPLMARILAPLAVQALQGADRLAGRRPRKSFGRPNGPLIMFIYDRLTCILGEDRTPTPENILQRLKRTTPKTPARGGPSRRKRA